MAKSLSNSIRRLVVVLGDQLTTHVPAFEGFDPTQDMVWMAEVPHESTKVWTHKARITLFLSGMRHFKANIESKGWPITYLYLDDDRHAGSLASCLLSSIKTLQPQEVWLTEAGEWQVAEDIKEALKTSNVPFTVHTDTTFLATQNDFASHAKGRKQLRMEYFYREMRVRYGILLTDTQKPEGDHWNYDAENRGAFGADGPVNILPPVTFPPDSITRQVMALVESRFPNHPGELTHFDWPVTTEEANTLLDDFIAHRLPLFGQYQDAMWAPTLLNKGSAYLAHSKLSAAINLKLLLPLTVIKAVEKAYRKGNVSLASAEGFIRQVLGWREFIRGIYWLHMPHYLSMNALEAHTPLPDFYWTGDTEMACLRHTIGQTLEYGYAHHIQRLMVTGLYALLLGVEPTEVHEWYLAMYMDAVEWVELPNSLGMSQFADGGIFASKPYIASGKYIQKMSNYCKNCAFKPDVKTGPTACPITTLYWDFLIRHYDRFINHPRLALQVRNVTRLSSDDKDRITQAATLHRKSVTNEPYTKLLGVKSN